MKKLTKKEKKALDKWADSVIDSPTFQNVMQNHPEHLPAMVQIAAMLASGEIGSKKGNKP